MRNQMLPGVLDHLCRVVAQGSAGELTDGQLLDAFVERRDEAAFELLVWRHAALVLGVCRRLLHDRHEAEDAFQATFLVFVRKARSIGKRDSVGSWLYKVAFRIAQRARTQASRRACTDLPEEGVPDREPGDDLLWRDLRPVLDEEVNRLPEKYRRPFVLCYLEGNTNEQAARQLGCPQGTVLSRLSRGREKLRAQLARRGIAVSVGALTALLSEKASAAVTPALVSMICKAAIPFAAGNAAAGLVSARAVAWTEGVLKAMLMTRLKFAGALVLVLALVATGAGLLPSLLAGSRPAAQGQREKIQPDRQPERPGGREAPRTEVRGVLRSVDAGKGTLTVSLGDGRLEATDKTFTLAKGAEIAIVSGGTIRRGAGGTFREGKLADLTPGAIVALLLSADGTSVESVLADGPALRGVIKAVDAGKGTLTVTLAGRSGGREGAPVEGEERTFTVDKTTEVGIDDGRGRSFSLKEAMLGDLATGALVTVKLAADLKHVQSVLAEGPVVQGPVKALDVGKKTITLMTRAPGRGGEAGEEQTFTVAPKADVLIDDGKGRRFSLKEGTLADLAVGALVTAKLSVDQSQIMSLRAEGPMVHGAFKSADSNKKTITVIVRPARGDNPEETKTFDLASDARVWIDGKEGKLSDIKAEENGPPVGLRLSLDQKAIQSVTVGGGRR
jgi:RNA polymerase sigma factor (sigma-70 family)